MEVKKDNRGGARPGGGRKKSDRVRATFKLDPDVVELLSAVDNKSDLINKVVREYLKSIRYLTIWIGDESISVPLTGGAVAEMYEGFLTLYVPKDGTLHNPTKLSNAMENSIGRDDALYIDIDINDVDKDKYIATFANACFDEAMNMYRYTFLVINPAF